ncbi:50S ribosomal protein L23 [Patescibacteria group bacterium]|nr:50S ribosomal protein L23 [Patescibacteria group bacterium]
MNTHRVLIRPLMTEKVNELMKIGKYVFEVAVNTNKIEISKAFEDVYKIRPININTLKMKGKVVGRGKIVGKRKNWKKVIVKLPKGKTIQIHEKV